MRENCPTKAIRLGDNKHIHNPEIKAKLHLLYVCKFIFWNEGLVGKNGNGKHAGEDF